MADAGPQQQPPPITAADLYGPSGQPHGSDITQGGLGDCYLISTLGQFADRQPGAIKGAISYDEKDHSFGVRLHDAAGRDRTIAVTQDDLRQDRTVGVDSSAYWSGTHPNGDVAPAWPGVMETAYAKLKATSPGDATGKNLDHIGHGGWPKDAAYALTGSSDTREVPASELKDPGKTYEMLHSAIQQGRPLLLATNPMKDVPTDGLVKGDFFQDHPESNSGHAYTVESVSRGKDGCVSLTLRNPWGHNRAPAYGVDTNDPLVHVDLKTILANGHLQNITVGPALTQKQRADETAHPDHPKQQNGAQPHANAPVVHAVDSDRSYWLKQAAAGAEIAKATQSTTQTPPMASQQGRGQNL